MSVAFIAREDGRSIRTGKEIQALGEAGYVVTLVGWDRSGEEVPPAPYFPSMSRILYRKKVGYGPRAIVGGLFGFLRHVFRAVLKQRPDVIHCVNEDLAVLGLILRIATRSYVVCDVYDSIALKWSSAARPVSWFARHVADAAQRASDLVIVTDETRAGLVIASVENVVVVPNYPPSTHINRATPQPPSSELRIFVSGAIGRLRGADLLARLLDREPRVRVVAAGWLQDEAAERLVSHDRVDFLGHLHPSEAAAACNSCHAVWMFYSPTNRNNIYASPNKLYDAVAAGRPVLANQELIVSHQIREQRLGYTVPYGNIDMLAACIGRLQEDLVEGDAMSQYYDPEGANRFTWERAKQVLLDAYSAMVVSRTTLPACLENRREHRPEH